MKVTSNAGYLTYRYAGILFATLWKVSLACITSKGMKFEMCFMDWSSETMSKPPSRIIYGQHQRWFYSAMRVLRLYLCSDGIELFWLGKDLAHECQVLRLHIPICITSNKLYMKQPMLIFQFISSEFYLYRLTPLYSLEFLSLNTYPDFHFPSLFSIYMPNEPERSPEFPKKFHTTKALRSYLSYGEGPSW